MKMKKNRKMEASMLGKEGARIEAKKVDFDVQKQMEQLCLFN